MLCVDFIEKISYTLYGSFVLSIQIFLTEVFIMNELVGACVIGQSGGPTAVINASALGAMQAAIKSPSITRVFGAAHGITGILSDNLYDIDREDPAELKLLRNTPSSALGSCRYKLKTFDEDPSDYHKILEIFKKYNIRYFFYNGGNDSMDTCLKISDFFKSQNYECRVMGIPKTIDNDLYGTDHCPGYPSAAKYIATSCMEIFHDARVYDTGSVTILEVMGRDAGWLVGASAVASWMDEGPDLVYLPEIPFDLETFLSDVKRIYDATGKCIVSVSEGIRDKDGVYISAYGSKLTDQTDSFGHSQLGGLAAVLGGIIRERLGVKKIRPIEFSLLQRCAAHCASATDIEEAYMAGATAVYNAVSGISGKMVAFERINGNQKYACVIKLVDLTEVANAVKRVPREWINDEGNGVEQAFIDYVLPLIEGESRLQYENGLPRFAKLKKIKAMP